jgi:hypothetical protein
MKWGEVLFWLSVVVTAACLLPVVEVFTGPMMSLATSLLIVVTLGVALRWAILEPSRLLQ